MVTRMTDVYELKPTRGFFSKGYSYMKLALIGCPNRPCRASFLLSFLCQGLINSTGALGATRLNSYGNEFPTKRCSASPLH